MKHLKLTEVVQGKGTNGNSNKMDLSFSGAGFMGVYYFGVVDCWNKYIPRDRVNRVAGASAGSLIAAYYLCDLPLGDVLREIIVLTEDIRRRPLGVFDRSNQVVDVLPRVLDKLFPADAHKRVSGRLHVCLTRLKDMKKIIVNQFETKKDLIDALNCSCFIPVWSGNHVSTYKGVKHIDGGFSDNLPVFDEHTIRICCFSGASDISPHDRAKMELLSGTVLNTPLYWNFANMRRFGRALFPPAASFIVDLLERGFHDTKEFILSNDLIQCEPCYSRTSLADRASPMLTPSASPALSRAGSFRALDGDENNNNNNNTFQRTETPTTNDKSFGALVSEKLLRISSSESNSDTELTQQENPVILVNDTSLMLLDSNSTTTTSSSRSSEDTRSSSACSAAESDGSDGTQTGQQRRLVCRIGSPAATNNKRAVPKQQQVPNSAGARRRNTLHFIHEQRQQADNKSSSSSSSRSAPALLVMEDKFTLAPSPLPSCPPSPNLNRHCTECIRLRQEARVDAVEREIRGVAEQYVGPQVQAAKVGGLRSKISSPLRWLKMLGTKSSYKLQLVHHPMSEQTTEYQRRRQSAFV